MSALEVDPKLEAEQAQRVAYVAMLRAIAELTEAGTIPLADSTSIAWHTDHDTATRIAAALGGEWRASDDTRDGSAVVNGLLVAGRYEFSALLSATLFVAPEVAPTEPRNTASRLLAADLTATIAASRRAQHLEVVEGDAGPDLRACCDHEAHEPNECPVPRCDCDGEGPTVVTDR